MIKLERRIRKRTLLKRTTLKQINSDKCNRKKDNTEATSDKNKIMERENPPKDNYDQEYLKKETSDK